MQNHEHEERFRFPDEKPEEEKLEIEIEGEPEIEVVDDTPEEDRGRKPMKDAPAEVTDEELAQYSDGVKKRIQHFSKGYHEERRAKETALREREEAIRIATVLAEENKKLKSLEKKKEVDAALTDAKRKLQQAYETGDANLLIVAQDALAAAKIEEDKFNTTNGALQQNENTVQPDPSPNTPAPKVDTKARAWQEANPWFGENEEMTAVALAVHKQLVNSGVDTNSDTYYDRINSRVRQLFPEAFTSGKRRVVGNVVTPATRSTAPRKIVLTQSQVNIAKRLGVPLELYARQAAEEMRKQNG
jgi:hypothetical protein